MAKKVGFYTNKKELSVRDKSTIENFKRCGYEVEIIKFDTNEEIEKLKGMNFDAIYLNESDIIDV